MSQEPTAHRMYRHAYNRVDEVLDAALGGDEEDGSGQGLAGDVYLLALQRDHARTLLSEAITALREHDPSHADDLARRARACRAADLMDDES